MKYMAVLLSMLVGIFVANVQSALVGFWTDVEPSARVTIDPVQPTELPATGVPNTERANFPFDAGPTVEKGFQIPYFAAFTSSLKSPCRSSGVGTLKIPFPIKCRMDSSQEKKKNVLFRPS